MSQSILQYQSMVFLLHCAFTIVCLFVFWFYTVRRFIKRLSIGVRNGKSADSRTVLCTVEHRYRKLDRATNVELSVVRVKRYVQPLNTPKR